MKTTRLDLSAGAAAAPIVQLSRAALTAPGEAVDEAAQLNQARAFATPLLIGRSFDTGEDALGHADGVAAILEAIGAAPSMRAAVYLVYASEFLTQPEQIVAQAFGPSYASLVSHTRKLVQAQRNARDALADETNREVLALQLERVRKMLLAFSHDLRVVLLRLASRLQTLRWHAHSRTPCPRALARETQQVFAPLANRLGIWQIKWELEDLAFRFLQPDDYRQVAQLLDQKRTEREQAILQSRDQLAAALHQAGLVAQVQGRPKHLYSIWKKMHGKGVDITRIFDVRALRVIVADVPECYAVLARVHELWPALPEEYDDYIARPKPNGYQSLHTVVLDADGQPLEIQIRTRAMHEHAESGIAAHWAYKEAGAKGYAGIVAAGEFEERVAEARRAVLHQLLAWERDFVGENAAPGEARAAGSGLFEDRIYVFTPQASLVDLPAGSTPIDFAYAVHTDLGHRCRGAKVDGAMVPLNTPLASGQTVQIISAKEGGPSLDWLNPQLAYIASPRSRAKVRAWFNAQALQETIARGREAVEKLLQREGKTSTKHGDLAAQLGFRSADALFEVVGKDEFSLRHVEAVLRPAEPAPAETLPMLKRPRTVGGKGPSGGVLVVGVGSLLTQLARCCRPAPPDGIGGYVTRGKGVAIHRADCVNLRQLGAQHPERLIGVAWDEAVLDGLALDSGRPPVYAVDVSVLANDRQGLLRDISEVFAKQQMNVTGVQTQSQRGTAVMTFTIEVVDTARLTGVLAQVSRVGGVLSARRK